MDGWIEAHSVSLRLLFRYSHYVSLHILHLNLYPDSKESQASPAYTPPFLCPASLYWHPGFHGPRTTTVCSHLLEIRPQTSPPTSVPLALILPGWPNCFALMVRGDLPCDNPRGYAGGGVGEGKSRTANEVQDPWSSEPMAPAPLWDV